MFAILLLLLPVAATAATTYTVEVSGQSNIFGAGLLAPPASPVNDLNTLYGWASGPGLLPTSVGFTPDPYLVLHFPSITGGVAYGDHSGLTGPEGFTNQYYGDTLLSTNVNSTAGISGIMMNNRVLFLVGVFLGETQPATAPDRLDATGANSQSNFNPLLGQTFFIGDGRTTSGAIQYFYVPTGATHLYLGFVDAFIFQGEPSWYGDNRGELVVNLRFDTPDPATVWLVSAPLAFLWYRARRRRRL